MGWQGTVARSLHAPRERGEKLDRSQCPAKHRGHSLASQITPPTASLLPKQFIIGLSNHSSNSLSIPHKTVPSPCQITPATVCLFLQKQLIISLSNHSSNKSVYSSKQLIISLSNHSSNSLSIPHKTVPSPCQITPATVCLFLQKQLIISLSNHSSNSVYSSQNSSISLSNHSSNSLSIPPKTVNH